MNNNIGPTLTLAVSTSDVYGPSTASVLITALTEHRDFSLRSVMGELENKNLNDAFLAYCDYKDCLNILDELLRSAVALSYENHSSPNRVARHTAEEIERRKRGDFEEFLKDFSLTDPDAE